jgi:hypothetical protein
MLDWWCLNEWLNNVAKYYYCHYLINIEISTNIYYHFSIEYTIYIHDEAIKFINTNF